MILRKALDALIWIQNKIISPQRNRYPIGSFVVMPFLVDERGNRVCGHVIRYVDGDKLEVYVANCGYSIVFEEFMVAGELDEI